MKIKSVVVAVLIVGLGACAQEPESPASAPSGTGAAPAAGGAPAPAAEAPAEAVGVSGASDIEARLANADTKMGQRQYIFCQACHTVEAGGMNKVGPNLHGIIGSPAGKAEGFVYSAALAESGLTWDLATLDRWIESPNSVAPGTTMVFAGVADAGQRADLIAYLVEATSAE
jgi:cytochrome c